MTSLSNFLLISLVFILLCIVHDSRGELAPRQERRFPTALSAFEWSYNWNPVEKAIDMRDAIENQFIELLQSFGSVAKQFSNPEPKTYRYEHTSRTAAFTKREEMSSEDSNTTEIICSGVGFEQELNFTIQQCGQNHTCNITEYFCGGIKYNASLLNDTTNCIVSKVSCFDESAKPVSIQYTRDDNCTLFQQQCDGTYYNQQEFSSINSSLSCQISQLICVLVDTNITTKPIILDFNQLNDTCVNISSEYECESACDIPVTETKCVCPVDYIGDSCQSIRNYECNYTLISPKPKCEKLDPLLDDDPVCLSYKKKDQIEFTYQMDCHFTFYNKQYNISEEYGNFTYFAIKKDANKSVTFAVSDLQEKMNPITARLKPYNFNLFSDCESCMYVNLTKEQLEGTKTINFTLKFDSIADRFYAGNRLYFEVGLDRDNSLASRWREIKYDKRLVDITDLKIERSLKTGLTSTVITWIIVGSLAGAVVLFVGGYWLKMKIDNFREKKRLSKLYE